MTDLSVKEAYERALARGVDWDSLAPAEQWEELFKSQAEAEDEEDEDLAKDEDFGPEIPISELEPGAIYWYQHREWKVVFVEPIGKPEHAILLSKKGDHREEIFEGHVRPGYGAPIRKVLDPDW